MLWWTLRQVNSEKGWTRSKGFRKLVARREIAVLAKLLEEGWSEAADALGTIADERCVVPLAAATMSSSVPVRKSAIRALGRIPSRVSLEALAVSFRDWSVQDVAREALLAIGGEEAADVLIVILEGDDASYHAAAAEALGTLRHSRAIEPLRKRLNHGWPGVCHAVAFALQLLGWKPSEQRERVLSATALGDWSALAELGEAGVPALAKGAEDMDFRTSAREATLALAQMDVASAITPLVIALTGSMHEVVRKALTEKHPGWARSPEAREAVPRLIELLACRDFSTEVRAAQILAEIGDQRALLPLVAALHNNQLVYCFGPDGDAYPARTAAAKALKTFGDAALEPLIEEFRNGRVNGDVGGAIKALPDATRRAAPRIVMACCEAGTLTFDGLEALLAVGITDARLFDALLRPMFSRPLNFPLPQYDIAALERLRLSSSLTEDNLHDTIAASGYDYEISGGQSGYELSPNPKLEASHHAIERLCRCESRATSNILHLVAAKRDVFVSVGPDDDRGAMIRFGDQRSIAAGELARRGNPPYEVDAYVRQDSAPAA